MQVLVACMCRNCGWWSWTGVQVLVAESSLRPRVISKKSCWGWWDFLRLALRRAVWMKKIKSCGWFGWLCWVRGCGFLDSTSSASACGKDADLTFGSLVWWWGWRPHAAGRGNGFLCFELSPATSLVFVVPTNRTSVAQGLFLGGPGTGPKPRHAQRL